VIAEEIRDLDLPELRVWQWNDHAGYPIQHDPRLGTRTDLTEAIGRCRELGVRVSLFINHHLISEASEVNPEWVHLNAAGQRVLSNWTFSRDFLPHFGPVFSARESFLQASALSASWRERGLAEYKRLLDLGHRPFALTSATFGTNPISIPRVIGDRTKKETSLSSLSP
jgi:hypothetical protein